MLTDEHGRQTDEPRLEKVPGRQGKQLDCPGVEEYQPMEQRLHEVEPAVEKVAAWQRKHAEAPIDVSA